MVKLSDMYEGYPLLQRFSEYRARRRDLREAWRERAYENGVPLETLTVSPYGSIIYGEHEYDLQDIDGVQPGQTVQVLYREADMLVIHNERAHIVEPYDWTVHYDELERECEALYAARYTKGCPGPGIGGAIEGLRCERNLREWHRYGVRCKRVRNHDSSSTIIGYQGKEYVEPWGLTTVSHCYGDHVRVYVKEGDEPVMIYGVHEFRTKLAKRSAA